MFKKVFRRERVRREEVIKASGAESVYQQVNKIATRRGWDLVCVEQIAKG
jgi:hypothetical protein